MHRHILKNVSATGSKIYYLLLPAITLDEFHSPLLLILTFDFLVAVEVG